MNPRPWYDVFLLLYIAVVAALEAVLLERITRLGWAMTAKAIAKFIVFMFGFLTVFFPALLTSHVGPMARALLAGALTWESVELIRIGWTKLTAKDASPEDVRRVVRSWIGTLIVIAAILAVLVIVAINEQRGFR